jgi:hypothetical protein
MPRVVCPVCDTTLSSTPYRQLENQAPKTTGGNQLYNTLELLMMGIMVPETCWASNKICNKKHLLHLVGVLFPHINDDAQSKSLQIWNEQFQTTQFTRLSAEAIKYWIFLYINGLPWFIQANHVAGSPCREVNSCSASGISYFMTPASYVTVRKSPPLIPEPHESGPHPPSHPLIYT